MATSGSLGSCLATYKLSYYHGPVTEMLLRIKDDWQTVLARANDDDLRVL